MNIHTPSPKRFARLREFARVWNSVKGYPALYDMERALNLSQKSLLALAREYRDTRTAYPDLGLPLLVARRTTTGLPIALPGDIAEQLEVFRIDTKHLATAPGIIVTSAQFGAPLNTWFWRSLTQYATYRNFPIVVLPIKYGPIHIEDDHLTSTFPDELVGHLLFEDYPLCGGELVLSTMRMRPTLMRFLTDAVCEVGGFSSQIFAAPKLELEHRPRVGRKYPKAVMTTGAVTHPNYGTDKLGQQDRTGEIAAKEHNYSAIVVECKKRTFHFRQLHANKRGLFYDIDPVRGGALLVTPQGVEHRPHDVAALVCGDWHTGKTEPDVRKATLGKKGMLRRLTPDDLVLHDFVDCDSVSHWEQHQAVRRGFKAPLGWDSLEKELEAAVAELKAICSRTLGRVHVVASNHNEYVREYIETLRWVRDDANLDIGARLYTAMVDELKARQPRKHEARPIDPVAWYLTRHVPRIQAHDRQDALVLPRGFRKGILCSLHGDIAVGGGLTRSTKAFRKMNQRITLGHNHSATILGHIWRVGTSTPLMQAYVSGPTTNWTNTHQIIFKNGQRQLVNIVNGRWHG